MQKMTGRERILSALNLKEPDMVPHMELFTNPKFVEKVLPNGTYEDFIEHLDIDGVTFYTVTHEKYDVLDESKGLVRDKWGVLKRDTGHTTPHPVEAAIKSEKDLENYVVPNADEPSGYEYLVKLVKRFKGERCIVAIIEQPFMRVNEILGAAEHYINMITNPDLVLKLNEIVTEHHLKSVKNFIDIGADVVCFTGDFATNEGPLVSPEHLEKFGIPPLAKLAQVVNEKGIPCILHSDGYIMPIMEMLLNIKGINALHPIDPVAGMDVGEVKEKYGHRICIIGSIDCGPLLMWGTVDQVRQAVKENIKKAGKGGGLITGTSHSLHAEIKTENYIEMVKAIREYGKYPLSF